MPSEARGRVGPGVVPAPLRASAVGSSRSRAGGVPEDLGLSVTQLLRRLDTELLVEQVPIGPIRLQGLRLPAAPVEGQHQLGSRPLPERVISCVCRQPSGQLMLVSDPKIDLEALFGYRQP